MRLAGWWVAEAGARSSISGGFLAESTWAFWAEVAGPVTQR